LVFNAGRKWRKGGLWKWSIVFRAETFGNVDCIAPQQHKAFAEQISRLAESNTKAQSWNEVCLRPWAN